MQTLAELDWQLIWFVVPVQGDGFPDGIDYDFARITLLDVLLELGTEAGVDLAVDVITQEF